MLRLPTLFSWYQNMCVFQRCVHVQGTLSSHPQPHPTPPTTFWSPANDNDCGYIYIYIYLYRICSRSQPSKLMFCKFYVTNIHSDGDNPGMCIFEVSDICELILNNRWSLKYVSQIGKSFLLKGKNNDTHLKPPP